MYLDLRQVVGHTWAAATPTRKWHAAPATSWAAQPPPSWSRPSGTAWAAAQSSVTISMCVSRFLGTFRPVLIETAFMM